MWWCQLWSVRWHVSLERVLHRGWGCDINYGLVWQGLWLCLGCFWWGMLLVMKSMSVWFDKSRWSVQEWLLEECIVQVLRNLSWEFYIYIVDITMQLSVSNGWVGGSRCWGFPNVVWYCSHNHFNRCSGMVVKWWLDVLSIIRTCWTIIGTSDRSVW